MFCTDIPAPIYFIFSNSVPPLLYYSHIPVLVISLLIGIFVFLKNKTLLSKILLTISVLFSIWNIFSLITWTHVNSQIISFIWSFFGILTALIFISCIYFVQVYITKKDVNLWIKYIWLLMLLPLFVFIKYAAPEFDIPWCEVIESPNYYYYYYLIGLISFLWILVFSTYHYFKTKEVNNKKEILYLTFGISAFLISFFITGFFASYIGNFELEQYGLFGMLVFMAYLSFLIVRFKSFNIKLLGAQALVWAIGLLVGSQFFFVKTTTNMILTGITLFITVIAGYILVQSVKKVDEQREELEVANNNQQLLIRFITHQVKGFFTKSKMVFASILEGDVGKVSDPVKEIAEQGMDSDNQAVAMVQEILQASSLRSGTVTYNFEETDFTEFVRGIAEMFKDNAVQKGLNLEINLPQEKVLAKIDKLQMTQVIKNLIDNSVKYTMSGFVKVDLKLKEKNIIFSVSDSGVGLSDSDKDKLFKEGGRGEESLRVNVTSTGYGLYIVKKIVEGHGGKIWAESAGRGHGTTFYVEIPLSVK